MKFYFKEQNNFPPQTATLFVIRPIPFFASDGIAKLLNFFFNLKLGQNNSRKVRKIYCASIESTFKRFKDIPHNEQINFSDRKQSSFLYLRLSNYSL